MEFEVINEQGSGLNEVSPTVIKIIGCGGGGSSAVGRMIEAGVSDVQFIVLNTDLQALSKSPAQYKLAIGQKLTGGLGAGGNPAVGESAAKEDVEKIRNIVKGADGRRYRHRLRSYRCANCPRRRRACDCCRYNSVRV